MANINSIAQTIEEKFVESLSLIVLTSSFDLSSEYRRGWFDGYAQSWRQMTGNSTLDLVDKVNDRLDGSWKKLEI